MNNQRQARVAYLNALLKKSKRPRNQIAAISGLSNAYIRALEQGSIGKVGREKLIHLAIALSLDLNEHDDLLTIFGLAKLNQDDIPVFLEISNRSIITPALHPLRTTIATELLILSIEKEPGLLVIVSDRPTHSLRSEGHRSHSDKRLIEAHHLYSGLMEAIVKERKANLSLQLVKYEVEHYVCKNCLEEYAKKSVDSKEKKWRLKHFKNLIWHIKNYKNFHFYLTNTCPNFIFDLKFASKFEGMGNKLFFMGKQTHFSLGAMPSRLTGFVTDNKVFMQDFKEEYKHIK
ncbi:MAG: hypothetical protein ACTSWK_00120, partial [Promethearchaeota archaeon]